MTSPGSDSGVLFFLSALGCGLVALDELCIFQPVKINIKVKSVASFYLRVFCLAVILLDVLFSISFGFMDHPILYTVLFIGSLALMTAKEFVKVDMNKRVITEGYW